MNYQIVKKTRDSFILNLRQAFATDTRYPYLEPTGNDQINPNSKIDIVDITPQSVVFYPSVIVSAVAGPEGRYLQEDLIGTVRENGIDKEDVMGSNLTLTVRLEVMALDSIIRDEVIDTMYHYLKRFTSKLAADGIAIINSDITAERQVFTKDRWFYLSGLAVRCYSEWTDVETIEDVVEGINLTEVTILPINS